MISTRVIHKAPLRRARALGNATNAGRALRTPSRWMPASRAQTSAKLARRDALVLEHLGLAKAIAISVHQSLPGHMDLDDLVQAGVIGLFDAAMKFDTDRQDVFPLYAKHRVRGAILDSLRQLDWASRDMRRRQKLVESAKHDLTATLQRAPTEAEVALRLVMDVDRFRVMMVDLENTGPISADTRADQCGDLPSPDFPTKPSDHPDFICIRKELRFMLGAAIKTLPERYQKVVTLYYTKQLTMREIGRMFGINESRVSQIHKSALQKLAIVLHENRIDSIHAFQD